MQNIRSLDNEHVNAAAGSFRRLVCESEVYRSAGSVFVYVSVGKEPATHPIIRDALEAGKNVFVPKCLSDGGMAAIRIFTNTRFRLNQFSIPEPVEETERENAAGIDLCVIPCVAAAPCGARLGRGGGYYDRYLSGSCGYKLCLCYEINLLYTLPVEPHDVRMDMIVTEKRKVACK